MAAGAFGVKPGTPLLSLCRYKCCGCRAVPDRVHVSTGSCGRPLPSSPLLLPAVALDVEYGHWRSNIREAQEVAVAAWVAVVDEHGAIVFDARIRQRCQLPSTDGSQQWSHWGGVPCDEGTEAAAEPHSDTLSALLPHLKGHLVVGHGVTRDAEALGLGVEPLEGSTTTPWRGTAPGFLALRPTTAPSSSNHAPASRALDLDTTLVAYDTKAFPGFQGRSGVARSLSHLARQHLGRHIQQKQQQPPQAPQQERSQSGGNRGRRRQQGQAPGRSLHNAVEDAAAVAELYAKVARPQLLLDAAAAGGVVGADAFDLLVELNTRAMLSGGSRNVATDVVE